MNALVLDVYRVIYLLVGLCLVWCSTSSDSEEVCAHIGEHALQQINRIVKMTMHFLNLHISHEDRIFVIKNHNIGQCIAKVVESKGHMDQNLTRTNNDYFGPLMKEYERIIDHSPSLVVREVLIQKSAAIIAQKLLGYINGCLDGKCVHSDKLNEISNVVTRVLQLSTIKLDHTTLETQLQSTKLKRTATEIEEKIAKIEIEVIRLAKGYDSNALYERYNEAEKEEEELTQLLKKDGLTTILELLQKSEENVRNRASKDRREIVDRVEAVIDAIRPKLNKLKRDDQSVSNISESDWAIFETISQQKRHKEKRALKVTYLKSIRSQLFSIMDQLNNSQVSYLTICSKESNDIQYDLAACDPDHLNLGLDGEGCTIDLTDEQGRLLKKLQKSTSCNGSAPVCKLFDANEVNNIRTY
ncbi:hypothetical protein NEHOM01_1716, partial [Nematocida homosporus]|uniref:uncharacterized protein n=1 Tax=Nematocida homosporus TaxID=1912981 RepID=UPI0022202192